VRKLFPFIAFVVVVGLVGYYAWTIKRDAHAAQPTAAAARLAQHDAPGKPMAVVNGRPVGMLPYVPAPAFDPHHRYKPGEYVPRGFSANFREQIVKDFGDAVDYKLGKDFPADKRKKMAEVQNAFWDEHGPDVDLFKDGKISQPEFAEKTHLSTMHFMNGMAEVLDDAQYLKLFDLPKDVDAFYQLYHSAQEQPGMPLQGSGPQHADNSVMPKPAPEAQIPAHVDEQGQAQPASPAAATPPAAGWTPPAAGEPKH
jgi:hypothetical protein